MLTREYLEYSSGLEKEKIARKKCTEKEKHSQTTHLMENHRQKRTQGEEEEEKDRVKYDCKSESKTHCTCSCCLRWKGDDSIAQVAIDREENLVSAVTSATLCTPSSQVTLPIRTEYTEDTFFRKYSHLFDFPTDSINRTSQPSEKQEWNSLTYKLLRNWSLD